MPGTNRATGRVVALIALLLLVGIALRGYLPPETRDTDQQSTNNPAAIVGVLILLVAAITIITIAIVAALRKPRTPRPDARALRDSPVGDGGRPTWRFVLIALLVLLVWLVCVVLLLRLSGRIEFGQPRPTTPSTPTPGATPTAPPQPPQEPSDNDGGNVMWPLFATTMFMVLLWVAGIIMALRRNRRTPQPQRVAGSELPPAPPGAQPLAVAAERGLAAMGDLGREPREAIIACYAAMEDALADAPEAVPQDSDTPSEVLARAIEHHAVHGSSARELVDLFAEARFSPHVMNEQHRERAVRALEAVLAELRSAV